VSRRETDRALLRAFGDAARLITLRPLERLIFDEHAWACGWRTTADRRRRVYRRHYAHALATAWGL